MEHIPVLKEEVLQAFAGKTINTFLEGTVGLGGHAEIILKAHSEIETYFAFDRDDNALTIAKEKLAPFEGKTLFVHEAFGSLKEILGQKKIDGFFIDIGVSSMQLDTAERGFSFRFDAPLDMRMDPSRGIRAEDLINELPEKDLADMFYKFGEEYRSRAAARAIVVARQKKRISTTHQLTHVLEKVLRKGKIHFATKVFQALRIAVNDELGQLEKGLQAAIEQLNPGGICAVISFHSLEDRIVKWLFKQSESVEILSKKPIEASREEKKKNGRSRSAKLRIAKKR